MCSHLPSTTGIGIVASPIHIVASPNALARCCRPKKSMMTTTISETYTPPIIPKTMAKTMNAGKVGMKGRMLAHTPVKQRHRHMMLLRFIKPGGKEFV